jgi:hypothetical protein
VKGTDQEKMKNLIFEKTGFLPSITENGTHYVANMRLSLELLKEICDSQENIVRITGDYTGGIGGRRIQISFGRRITSKNEGGNQNRHKLSFYRGLKL